MNNGTGATRPQARAARRQLGGADEEVARVSESYLLQSWMIPRAAFKLRKARFCRFAVDEDEVW